MKKADILKKVSSYLLLYSAMTLFFYFIFNAGLYPYLDEAKAAAGFDNAHLLQRVYLPFMFAFLSLGVGLLSQFTLLKIGGPYEERIYGMTLVVFFGFYFLLALLFLIKSAINGGVIAEISLIPVFLLAAGEIALGVVRLVDCHRALAEDKAQEEQRK